MASVKSENGQFNTITNKAGSGAPIAPSGFSLGSSSDVLNRYETISADPILSMAVPGTSSMIVAAKKAVKIGCMFFFEYNLVITKGTGTGAVDIILPVVRASSGGVTENQLSFNVRINSGITVETGKITKGVMYDGTATLALCEELLTTGALAWIIDTDLAATANITIMGSYFI